MQKLFVRAFALVTCLIIFSSALMPVKAKAGLFDESWLDDWDIYNNVETFGNIDAVYDDPAFASVMSNNEINANMAHHYVLKGFAKNHPDVLEQLEKFMGVESVVEMAKGYWALAEAAESLQVAVNKLNSASESSKAVYVLGIYNATKDLKVEDIEKYKEEGKNNAEAITNYFEWLGSYISTEVDTSSMTIEEKTKYTVVSKIVTKIFENEPDDFFTDIYDAVAVWDGNTHANLEAAKSQAGEWMRILFEKSHHSKNVDAFRTTYTAVADYLLKVKDAAAQLYGMVDPSYYDNIALKEEPGLVEEHLAKMLRGIGSSLQNILDRNTLRFENIVYGRVKTRTGNVGLVVNNFSFELADKNVYGVTGATIYVILRGLLFLGVLVYLMYYLAKDAMLTSSRVRSKLKENVGYVILAVCLLYAMPNLLDLALHLRDSLLYTLADRIQDSTFARLSGLAKNFRDAAEHAGTFVSACEYLGMVVITAYLAFLYIAMACSMTIMFAFFPVFVVFSFRDRKIMNEWVSFTLGIITTPLIDAVLFLLPLVATHISNVPDVVQLLLCMSIIPARGTIRRLLGFASSMGSELVGLGAIMAAGRAVGAVTRTVRNTAHNVSEGVSSIRDDRANAKFYDSLASAEEGGSENASGTASGTANGRASSFGSDVASTPIGENVEHAVANSGGSESGNGGGSSLGSSAVNRTEQFFKDHPNAARAMSKITNTDSPEFKFLDPKTKARIYRDRVKKTAAQTLLKTAGGVAGGMAGGSIGVGAGTFLGANATMMMGGMGLAAGSDVGSAAGNIAGTGVAAAIRGGRSLYESAHANKNTAMSLDSGIGSEDFGANEIMYTYMGEDGQEHEMQYAEDIRAGIIGDSTDDTIANIMNNDTAFADEIYNNFTGITNNPEFDREQIQDALIATYARYADVGAAMQNEDRVQAYDTAYIPTNSKLKSMNAMHDCLRMGAEARVDMDGSIYFSKPESMSSADYNSLEYAFPKVNYGYSHASYYDEKKRTSYSPSDGYIGSGMIENMKHGDSSWGIPNPDSTNVDNIGDMPSHSPSGGAHSTTPSSEYAGGAVKGGPRFTPGAASDGVMEDAMERFYREHPDLRPNAT